MLFIGFSPLFLVFLIRLHLLLIHWVDFFRSVGRSFVRLFARLLMTNSFRAHSSVPSIERWPHNCAWFTFKQNGVHWNGLKRQANQVSMCSLICSVSAFASYQLYRATNYRMHMLWLECRLIHLDWCLVFVSELRKRFSIALWRICRMKSASYMNY